MEFLETHTANSSEPKQRRDAPLHRDAPRHRRHHDVAADGRPLSNVAEIPASPARSGVELLAGQVRG